MYGLFWTYSTFIVEIARAVSVSQVELLERHTERLIYSQVHDVINNELDALMTPGDSCNTAERFYIIRTIIKSVDSDEFSVFVQMMNERMANAVSLVQYAKLSLIYRNTVPFVSS